MICLWCQLLCSYAERHHHVMKSPRQHPAQAHPAQGAGVFRPQATSLPSHAQQPSRLQLHMHTSAAAAHHSHVHNLPGLLVQTKNSHALHSRQPPPPAHTVPTLGPDRKRSSTTRKTLVTRQQQVCAPRRHCDVSCHCPRTKPCKQPSMQPSLYTREPTAAAEQRRHEACCGDKQVT